ncbi:ATP-binding protein [Rhodobacterales bacterium HKCCE4037]|nr:ATP-binding protein [Rhodobacterales bacterium HKCCE4037]
MALPELEETLTSRAEEVRRVLERVRQHLLGSPGFEDIADTAQIVLGEALNNIVEHAYDCDPSRPIYLSLRFCPDALECRIEDEGIAMPGGTPPKMEMPSVTVGQRDTLPEGGFGWAMIHAMTVGLSYRREKDRNLLSFSIPVIAA